MRASVIFGVLTLCLFGCAALFPQAQHKQFGSVVDYLYGDQGAPVEMRPEVTTLHVPVRVGLAFVPSQSWTNGEISEEERLHLLERVKAAFAALPFIATIEVLPSAYLKPHGGFVNLEQAARMFNVDVVALLSYDQIQFNDSNALSVLYWTIIGAYLIHGDQYDIQTMLDATVFDVASHKLLFRAPGMSHVKGSAALATFTERSRAARLEGYNQALDQLIPSLQKELDSFRERIKAKADATVQIQYRAGYPPSGGNSSGGGGGSLDLPTLILSLAGVVMLRRRRLRDASATATIPRTQS